MRAPSSSPQRTLGYIHVIVMSGGRITPAKQSDPRPHVLVVRSFGPCCERSLTGLRRTLSRVCHRPLWFETSNWAIAPESGKPGCFSSQKNSPTGLTSRKT